MSGLGGILDVVIGMSFVYLLLSMVCSGINELLAWGRGLRSKTLADGIGVLLRDPEVVGLGAKLYEHPLIQGLSPSAPSYLPSSTFVLALLDTLRRETDATKPVDTLEGIKAVLAALPPASPVRRQLELFTDETVKDAAAYRRRLETWFDDSMERVSGVYKRRAQRVSMLVGVALAIGTGVDSGLLADALIHDSALRQATAAAAVDYVKVEAAKPDPAKPPSESKTTVNDAAREVASTMTHVDALDLPIGLPYLYTHWKASAYSWVYLFLRVVGLVFTGFTLALGSPFWFDLLSKLINLRLSGDPPKTSKENQATPRG